MLIRIRYLPFVFIGIVLLGIALGLSIEPWVGWRTKRPEIILLGSGNVHPFLETHVPKSVMSRMDPLWIDAGSGAALDNAFRIFNYGRSVGVNAKDRVGFIAMSSYGTSELAETLESSEVASPQKSQNWFLSIVIAERPLTIFYRNIGGNLLNVQSGDRLPQKLGSGRAKFEFVRISDLKGIFEKPEMPGIIRYFPEAKSGTRFLFEAAAIGDGWGDRVNWPDGVKEVPDYLEDLGDNTPFLELASELQGPHTRDGLIPCQRMRNHQINAALICSGAERCEHIVASEYALVFKLEKSTGTESVEYHIPNPSECRIARVFAPEEVRTDCFINLPEIQPSEHILTVSHPTPGLPDYLSCSP